MESLSWILEDKAFHKYSVCTLMSSIGIFWVLSFLFSIVDVFQIPKALLKYKVQPGKNVPVDKRRLAVAIGYALGNQVFLAVPLSALLYCLRWRRIGEALFSAPSLWWMPLELGACAAVTEILFYYSHRLLHSPLLYRRVHKLHHEWQAPVAVVAMYAHPVEFLFSNLIPVLAGPLIINSCLATECVWLVISVGVTTLHHSGYRLPYIGSPDFHDFHHLKFVGNYGSLGLLDRLHGTDAAFRAHQQRLRLQGKGRRKS